MKSRLMMPGLLALALFEFTASACHVVVRIACPNDNTASGILVTITGVGSAYTDSLGIVAIQVPSFDTYTVCVDTTTLPPGATLDTACQEVTVTDEVIGPDGEVTCIPALTEFVLGGDFCSIPAPQGECWLTGGGTVDKIKGKPHYTYGGVVYPGCSPDAADGGNWNVVDHATGLHFQGKHIVVDLCSGVPTRSPKVNVNIIDFHGTGIISGIAGNPAAKKTPVTFVARAIDHREPGHDVDELYLEVSDGTSIVLQIGNSVDDPAIISTGNLQIHTSSCGK